MPRYRLVADHGHPTAQLEATDDAAAEVRARQMSGDTATSKVTGFRLEREDDGSWSTVAAWMPRWIWAHPGRRNTLVRPEPQEQLAGIDIDETSSDPI